jgi:type II secretory pathway predicted ATPase ExeA
MRRPSNLMNSTTAPDAAQAAPHAGSPANYLELYGLAKPPFGAAADRGGFMLFGSRKRGFEQLTDHMVKGTGLVLLHGEQGSGKTETLRAAAVAAAALDVQTIMVSRPSGGQVSLLQLISALMAVPDVDDTMTDQAIDGFLAAPRKVLLAEDIDLMPNECARLLRSLAQRIPDAPDGPAIVLTSATDLSDFAKRPDLSSFVTLARRTIRLMPIKSGEVRQYIERSLWISGGTTRRLLSSDAVKLLVARSGGLPGAVNQLMEGAFTSGFARGDPVITAKTFGAAPTPTSPRLGKRPGAPSGLATIAIQFIAIALLVTGAAVFLYKGLGGEFTQSRPTASEVPVPQAAPATLPGPQPVTTAKTVEPMSADLMAALMKRGDQSLDLGDIAAARLLFQRAADAGNAAAATSLGKTYDPNFAAPGGKPDAARAADWYRKAIALGDTRAADMLKRLGGR